MQQHGLAALEQQPQAALLLVGMLHSLVLLLVACWELLQVPQVVLLQPALSRPMAVAPAGCAAGGAAAAAPAPAVQIRTACVFATNMS
jgi:hypothetical protein